MTPIYKKNPTRGLEGLTLDESNEIKLANELKLELLKFQERKTKKNEIFLNYQKM